MTPLAEICYVMDGLRSIKYCYFCGKISNMIDVVVFEKECTFRTSRSSGKGGQHVNKTETKVGLWFDVDRKSTRLNSSH